MGKVLQVDQRLKVSVGRPVQWSDMFYTSGRKDQGGRGSATDARVDSEKECPRKIMDPSTGKQF